MLCSRALWQSSLAKRRGEHASPVFFLFFLAVCGFKCVTSSVACSFLLPPNVLQSIRDDWGRWKFVLLRLKTQSLSQLNKHTKSSKQWYYFRAAVEKTQHKFRLPYILYHTFCSDFNENKQTNWIRLRAERPAFFCISSWWVLIVTSPIESVRFTALQLTLTVSDASQVVISAWGVSPVCQSLSSVGTTLLFIFSYNALLRFCLYLIVPQRKKKNSSSLWINKKVEETTGLLKGYYDKENLIRQATVH